MKSTESLSVTLNPQTLRWISLSYLLMLLPLYSELTPLIYIGGVSIIGWRFAIANNKLKPPPARLKNLLVVLCMVGMAFLWRSVGLLPAMLNLLVAGCTLKFLEFNSRRHLSLHVLRITSYNVCYTKLLRQEAHTQPGLLSVLTGLINRE